MSGSLLGGPASTIPMDVAGGGGPSSPPAGGANSALGQFSQVMGIQQQINTQRNFSRAFNAQQRAGQIISSYPDLETGLEAARKDPTVAQAPEVLNSFAELGRTSAQTKGIDLANNQTGLQAVMKAMSAAIVAPEKAKQYFDSAWSSLPPGVQKGDKAAADQLFNAITDGGKASGAEIQRNLVAQSGAAGFSPDMLSAITGTGPLNVDLGDYVAIGGRSLLSGQPVGAPTLLGKGLPEQVATVPKEDGGTKAIVVGGGRGIQSGGVRSGGGGGGGTSSSDSPPPSVLNMTADDVVNNLMPKKAGRGSSTSSPSSPQSSQSSQSANVLGASPGTYSQGLQKGMVDYTTDLNNRVSEGYRMINSIAESRDALRDFKPGAGKSTYAKIAEVFQALGAKQELVDRINAGDMGASQDMAKQAATNAMTQLRAAADTGKITGGEYDIFMKNTPNPDTDPRAIEKIYNYWSRVHQENVVQQQALGNYAKTGQPIERWPQVWNDIRTKLGYAQPVITQGGAALENKLPQGTTVVPGTKPGSLGQVSESEAETKKATPSYGKSDEVVKDFKAGKISREDAKRLLIQNGWAK